MKAVDKTIRDYKNGRCAFDQPEVGRLVSEIERLRALLGEIASGLSVRNPFDIANEAINPAPMSPIYMKGEPQ